jgi:hypothetical protein
MMMKMSRGKVGDTMSTYSSYTRQACNFVFPNISEIINGEKRTNDIMKWGLKSITHLPRSTFKGSRFQTCILEMKRGKENE